VAVFQNGLNALHLASKLGYIDVIRELLQRKIDLNATTKVPTVTLSHSCQALLIS